MRKLLIGAALMAMIAVLVSLAGRPAAAEDLSSAVLERRGQLERELQVLETEIDKERRSLEDKKKQRVSLERDTAILDAKIKTAKLSIKARNLAIQKLNVDIRGKTAKIAVLEEKIEDGRITASRNLTASERGSLESKRNEEAELLILQELEKKKIEEEEAEKRYLLKITKGVEAEYQKILKQKEKSAAAIRSELFSLRGSQAITFDKALEYAQAAYRKTGVRPAFLLGVIAEESNLGENVGTGQWRVDMKSPRDTEPFLRLTAKLGLDPDQMPVSKRAWYGWGGAMGPAQIIPSTWILIEERVSAAAGKTLPNPWDPSDAFMAAALILMDNGADAGTPASERLAALRYLAGWKNAGNRAYAFYGDEVMELAAKYQRQIDILNVSQ
ncbi:MAG: hypothetical protein HYT43_02080 [Candidatus Taylorbacteria bacterium]|nr:hypothetical protein [Candidatus Taylorbacteria bacterium]